ncbi:MAG: DMT family transporter [Chloroflexota bacterium]
MTPSSSIVAQPKTHVWAGWFFAISASLCFSIAPPLTRWVLLAGMQPTILLFLRFLLSTILLFAILSATNPARLRINRQGLLTSLGIGAITGSAMLSFFWSLTRIEASMSSMILSTVPLFVLILLAVKGEPFTKRHLIRLALALLGAYLLIGPGGKVDMVGIGLAVLAVMLFGIQLVLVQWYLIDYDATTVVMYTMISMTLLIGIWWGIEGVAWQMPNFQEWLVILILVIVSTLLARLTLYTAVRHIGSGQLSLLTPLETVFTITWSILFLQERLSTIQWMGGFFIVFSALLAASWSTKSQVK